MSKDEFYAKIHKARATKPIKMTRQELKGRMLNEL